MEFHAIIQPNEKHVFAHVFGPWISIKKICNGSWISETIYTGGGGRVEEEGHLTMLYMHKDVEYFPVLNILSHSVIHHKRAAE